MEAVDSLLFLDTFDFVFSHFWSRVLKFSHFWYLFQCWNGVVEIAGCLVIVFVFCYVELFGLELSSSSSSEDVVKDEIGELFLFQKVSRFHKQRTFFWIIVFAI